MECGSKLVELDMSKSKSGLRAGSKAPGRAFKCPKCNIIYFDEHTSAKVKKDLNKAIKDKLIKVDESIWQDVQVFVRDHKCNYPSVKFFTQKALLEKLARESKMSKSA